ncbi:MAG TPA: ferritin-like domain-containing protein [Solirubrobacteraceae bacterium]|nr:ferritin-like domain-containing protein [Solirubrobacteraceae bacterium]
MERINLEAIDVDGAVRETAEAAAGDTRLGFLSKGVLAGGAVLGGGAILSALVPSAAIASGRPPGSLGSGDIGILNYALTLEYLESSFYNEATSRGKITDPRLRQLLRTVTKDENYHVKYLKAALGSHAIKKPKFDFQGIPGDEAKFAATTYVLENTGVHAYLGQAPNIQAAKILLAAAAIVTVEARHSGAIGLYLGKAIAPNGPLDNGLSAETILADVKKTGFIK